MLIDGSWRRRVWLFLAVLAALGLIALMGYFPVETRTGPALLLTIPAIQSLIFVALHATFTAIVRRAPVPLSQSQVSVAGFRYILDAGFWVILSFALIAGAALACAHWDVELPTRGSR
ncbi:hypothetical protein [Povalibacter uvarum]|nr:hypothetical protein [Povalibacter uvarum]